MWDGRTGPKLSDGAWGTQLQARGLALGDCPDAWNLTHAEQVFDVAKSYVEVGSRIILTNTFRANRIALEKQGLADEVKRINYEGVRISRVAAGDDAWVFASIGPSGKLLMAGDVTEKELTTVFEEQANALAAAGPQMLLLETFSDVEEARIALRAAMRTDLPVIVSFAFDTGRQRDRTLTGLRPEDAARIMTDEGADGVGANCGSGIDAFIPICKRMRQETHAVIWMKPNAGLPEIVDGKAVYRTTPEEFASQLPALLEAGATYVGGCCGTTPAFIKALAAHWPEG